MLNSLFGGRGKGQNDIFLILLILFLFGGLGKGHRGFFDRDNIIWILIIFLLLSDGGIFGLEETQ